MRIATFAAGVLPYLLHDAYVVEDLVQYRHRCRPSRRELDASADYVLRVRGWKGYEEPASPGLSRVASFPFRFDNGSYEIEVWFQATPSAPVLPSRIDLPCPVSN